MHTFPDFVIAGSAKSGTTALHLMLDQHPDIYMSQVKETNYFVQAYEPTRHFIGHRGDRVLEGKDGSDVIDMLEKYRTVFSGASDKQIVGEASPWYLINKAVPDRLRSYRDDVKVLIILRNPSDVAFANFLHQVRVGSESLSLQQIDEVFNPTHYGRPDLHPFCHHLELPRYSEHLPEWLSTFDRSNLHIMVYEEFNSDRRRTLSKLLDFLQLRDDVNIDVNTRVNASGLPRSGILQDLLQGSVAFKKLIGLFVPTKRRRKIRGKLEAMNTTRKIAMPVDVRMRFDKLFNADIDYVEQILGRKMTDWRKLRCAKT